MDIVSWDTKMAIHQNKTRPSCCQADPVRYALHTEPWAFVPPLPPRMRFSVPRHYHLTAGIGDKLSTCDVTSRLLCCFIGTLRDRRLAGLPHLPCPRFPALQRVKNDRKCFKNAFLKGGSLVACIWIGRCRTMGADMDRGTPSDYWHSPQR